MPRFGIKTMLVATACLALWFSTFTDIPGAYAIRRSFVVLIFCAAVVATIYTAGFRRAFWIGFLLAMFLFGSDDLLHPLNRLGAADRQLLPHTMTSRGPMTNTYTYPQNFDAAVSATIEAFWTLSISVLSGFIASYVYRQTHKTER